MKLILSAPFRTDFNLDSLMASEYPEILERIIDETVNCVSDKISRGLSLRNGRKDKAIGNLHFQTLNDDLLPAFANPIFSLNLDSVYLQSRLAELEFTHLSLQLKSGDVDYFDNTVGILKLEIVIGRSLSEIDSVEKLQKLTTKLCSDLVRELKGEELAILDTFISASNNEKHGIVKKIGAFSVFADRNFVSKDISKSQSPILWVTRILMDEEKNCELEFIRQWSQCSEIEKKLQKIGDSDVILCVGNSSVIGSIEQAQLSALVRTLTICSYFYLIYDILNKNLKQIFVKISTEDRIEEKYLDQINKTQSHIEFIENEFSDVLMGLQGYRKLFAKSWLSVWDYEALKDMVQSKKNAVSTAVEFVIQRKQRKYAKFIEAILAVIGGIALLDFSINLFAYSNSATDILDPIYGLVDIAKTVSLNATLYLIIFILMAIFLIVLKRR